MRTSIPKLVNNADLDTKTKSTSYKSSITTTIINILYYILMQKNDYLKF